MIPNNNDFQNEDRFMTQHEGVRVLPDDQDNSNENRVHQAFENEEGATVKKGLLVSLKKFYRWITTPLRKKYTLGVFFIVCVAIIWVASGMWIQFIFGDLEYNRPYFLTYFNTTLFALYNLGYLFSPTWRNIKWREGVHRATDATSHEAACSDAKLPTTMQKPNKELSGSTGSFAGVNGEVQYEKARDLEPTSTMAFDVHGTSKDTANSQMGGVCTEPIFLKDTAINNNTVNLGRESGQNLSGNLPGSHPSDDITTKSVDAVVLTQQEDTKVLPPYTLYKILHCSMFFCFYWFAANYLYNLSLSLTYISSNTVLSSTSNIWTLLLSNLILHKRVGILQCLAVALCVGGSLFVTLCDIDDAKKSNKPKDSMEGDLLALGSAFFYSVYTAVLSKCLPDDDRYSMAMVFGAVGLVNFVCFWPGLIALNSVGFEKLSFPSGTQFLALLLNSLIGTNLSDLLWARSVVLASPIVATLGVSLSTPFSMIAEAAINHKSFSALYVCGASMVFIGFVLGNLPKINFRCFKSR